MTDRVLTRREMLAAMASIAALPLFSGCGGYRATPIPTSGADAMALALLDSLASNLLGLFPESATSLGIDVGARAGLRSQLSDRSAAGQQRIARQLQTDLARVNAIDTNALSYATRTSFD